MAVMFPSQVFTDTKSPGEVEIFNRLRDDPVTKDWIVIHSLDIVEHRSQVSGEADFVVIIPGKGVLCIEVKAANSIRRESGLWYYGKSVEGEVRGPFRQASEAMHSLRKRVIDRVPGLSKIVFWSAVIFPYSPFNEKSTEWHDWQAVDRSKFTNHSVGYNLLAVLEQARAFLTSKPTAAWFHSESDEPTQEQCRTILKILRPDFEYFESPSQRLRRENEELKKYTEEQFSALDAMAANPRVLFQGPAGTGKTLLAVEAARRSAASGKKTLFVCFNHLLGNWLKAEIAGLPDNITGNLHSVMLSLSGITPPENPDASFWEVNLPVQAIEKLIELGNTPLFDQLIIDEAQDLLKPDYLDFLDLILKGGLSSGRWLMFGDFENQVIYEKKSFVITQLNSRLSAVPKFSLRANCRNTPRIAEWVYLLAGLSPEYSMVRRSDNQVNPKIITYSTRENEIILLQSVLKQLSDEQYPSGQIVVLSTKTELDSAAAGLPKEWGGRITSLRLKDKGGRVQYGSIHSFKGLEAPVVILTDINEVMSQEARSLFYTGITRAVDRIIALVSEDANRDMRKILLG